MDPAALADTVTQILKPFLGQLLAVSLTESLASSEAAKSVPDEAVRKLWQSVFSRTSDTPEILEAAKDIVADMSDADAEAAFRRQLRRVFTLDPSLARTVDELVRERRGDSAIVSGRIDVAIGGIVVDGVITRGEWNVTQASKGA